jgi:hypothetical protein
LLAAHGCQPDSILLEELGICRGQVRIDIAVVNGSVHGYEIKSDRDSLRRLAGQVELYSRVLDSATLVVGDRHLAEALKFLPKWWGVLRVEETSGPPRFRAVRRAANNPHRDSRSLVELLWLDDALVLLEAADAARGVRGKPRCVVWDRVCEKLSIDEIALAVRSRLKARAPQKSPQQRP